ncbi:polymer-forming cytoskeletal protein [Halobacteria archaeon AArc-dxtr1]|nr:polymer-forming cytoskeletal protein [Halobacteria archaeon AArc-dxtr1]
MTLDPTRRQFVCVSSGVLAAGLAGCLTEAQTTHSTTQRNESDAIGGSVDSGQTESGPIDDRSAATIVDDRDENVRSDGDVVVTADGGLDGNLRADGSVVLESGAAVDGNVTAADHALLDGGTEIDGNLEVGGDVLLNRDAAVDGASVDGNLSAGDTVRLGTNTEIDGNVSATSVQRASSATVAGNVTGDTTRIE